MFTSADLKKIIAEARPIIERQLDDALIVSGFRTTVTEAGGDWGQVKALLKAMIQDERDEAGGNKRVTALLEKADHATAYADMLGWGNLNENNYFETADRELIRGSVGREFPNDEPAGQTVEQGGEGGAALPADESTAAEMPVAETDATLVVMPHADGSIGSERHGESVPVDTNSDAAVEKKPSRLAHNQEIAGASPAPATNSQAAITGPFTSLAGAEGDADRPLNSAAANALKMRPLCLHADDLTKCGGYGRVTCHTCLKAHADAEGISA